MSGILPERDLRRLPRAVFGNRSHNWWATLGFMLIEGTTLLACVASYFYLRLNFPDWPPEPTPPPSLAWPTLHVAVMLASTVPARRLDRAAHAFDLGGVRRWLVVCCGFGLSFLYLRWRDFGALNVRWDTDAYGSIAWVTVGFHSTILVFQVVETLAFTWFMFRGRVEDKHFTDASDTAFYWYFLVGTWMALYLVVYLGPRVL
jgi:heme/copper-type cytochrome/quinol oxidase subunit 3